MIDVTARPSPFRPELVRLEVEPGACVAEIIVRAMECAGQPVRLAAYACVTIDERKVNKAEWLETLPPAGARVVINALPGDDFGSLFVQIAGFALSFAVPAFGPVVAGVSIGQLAVRAGITLASSLIAQAIAPNPRQTLTGQRDAPTPASYSITGIRNEARPYGAIPMVYGRLVNFHPPLASLPFTNSSNANGDQYLHMLFGWMGECSVDSIKLGDTPIGALRAISYETRSGASTDTNVTLYPAQVREQALSIQLRQPNGYTYRTTEPDTDEITCEVLFPNGMGRITDRNQKLGIMVTFRVIVAPAGSSSFTPAPVVADNSNNVRIDGDGRFTVSAYSKAAIRRSVSFRVTRGEYQVGIARVTIDDQSDTSGDNQSTTFEDSYLSTIRSARFDPPLTQTGLAQIAVRAQANEQLNGVIDNLNCTVQRLLPVWNGSTWSAPQATRNPAWAFCDVLRGAGNSRPLADARLDLATILTWAQACDAAGVTFDGVLSERSSVWETLQEIAATGFASPTVRDGKYSVIHDKPRTTVIQHFSPRNSWGLKVTRLFGELPHAITVRFPNEATLHQADEITVYDDGYNAGNATLFEVIDLPYTTSALLAWKAGRRYLATARLRPRIISIETDIEFLICERGDLVRLSHDVMLAGISSARVKGGTYDGTLNMTAVLLDASVPMTAGQSYALRFRKSTGETILAPVDTVAGDQTNLTFTTPLSSGGSQPTVGDLVLFGVSGSESIECLVRSIEPRSDLSATMTLVDYAPAIFTADTTTIPDFNPRITLRPIVQRKAPAPPIIVSASSDEAALIRIANGVFLARILVAYELRPTANNLPAESIQARWRANGGASDAEYTVVPVQTGLISIMPVEDGDTVVVELRSISSAGATSEWVSITHTVVGRTTRPPSVERFYRQSGAVTWPYPDPPIDLAGFRLRAHYGTSTQWETARALHEGLVTAPPFDISALSGTQTILIKAVDTSGLESLTAASVTLALGDVLTSNVVVTQSEDPGFTGTLTGGTDTGTQIEASVLTAPMLFDPPGDPLYGAAGDPFYVGTVYSEMTYTARYTPQTSYLYDGILKLALTVIGPYTVDYRISTSPAFYGAGGAAFYGSGSAAFYDASAVGEWVSWPGELGPFETIADTYDIRVTTFEGAVQGIVSQFDLITDLPDVLDVLEDVAIASGSTRLPLTKTFRAITGVQLTVQTDGSGGISARIIDKDATLGPDVEVLNAAGTAVNGVVDAIIQGY